MGLNRSMFKNLLNKIHILQNIYLKNKYLIKKESYAMDGEDLAINQYTKKIKVLCRYWSSSSDTSK